MGTRLQKKLAKAIVLDSKNKRPRSGGALLKTVGYSEATAIGHTSEILESKGVKEELAVLGFSIEEADKEVAKILHTGKDENKLKAADMVYKRTDAYAKDNGNNINIFAIVLKEIKEHGTPIGGNNRE